MSARRAGPRSAEYVAGDAHERLAEDPRVAELGISVVIVGGDLYARGTVATPERREEITTVLREVCPGLTLHNEVTVADYPEPTAAETVS